MIKYKIKVKNLSGDIIVRAGNVFHKEEIKELIVDEPGFNLIKGCKSLRIEELICFCPFCPEEYHEEHELLTHIAEIHPEYFKFTEYEKIFIPDLGGKQITKLYVTDDRKVKIKFKND